MNPSELRMMWMSQYNPDRISLEDAASYFGHPSVGLSVMDDIVTHQQTMDLNPMMSIVGGDFNSQAAAAAAVAASSAAAAAALGVQPTTLITTNSNDIYGLAQMGGLHQQLLQQSAANVFQNYTEVIDDDDGSGGMVNKAITGATQYITGNIDPDPQQQQQQQQQQHQIFGQMGGEDVYDDGGGGGGAMSSDLTPKQEIINIDDFVMMTDSNSYDGCDFINDKDGITAQSSGLDQLQHADSGDAGGRIDDNELLVQFNDGGGGVGLHNKLLAMDGRMATTSGRTIAHASSSSSSASPSAAAVAVTSSSTTSGGGHRSQRKTRKIEPVNRPGLVLKTPIAYKGNIDPSVIPIQKDGMAVCERCGAIGVKHTFYTKSRRFCSMSCARGELYSLVVNNKMTGGGQQTQQQLDDSVAIDQQQQSQQSQQQQQQQQQQQSDVELALRVAHIKNSNYRFRITDQSKITQINGFGEPIMTNATSNSDSMMTTATSTATAAAAAAELETTNGSMNTSLAVDLQQTPDAAALANIATAAANQTPKALRMYRDVLPQDELPQIPKFERLPTPCPQMEKIISIRRRHYDPTHSFDWTPRLGEPDFYAAAVSSFPHAPGYEVWDNIGIDMKVEVENTDCDSTEVIQPGQTPHSFWVATILNICGYKALMRYEGFDDASHDFWVNLCNAEVHSVGWCATRGKPLIPPRTIENKYKDWKDFLVERLSGARTLPSSFYNKINDSLQSRFRLGLNLECVDKDRISQVRLATVTKIVGKRLFLRYFDSDDGFWCHEDSPIIHPVGWATTVGHNLAAPQDYLERMLAGREAMIEVHEDDATIELFKMNFTFEEYYLDGKTNGFIEGMKLEAVDPLNLSSICAATVMAVLKFGYMMIRIDSYQPDATGSDWFCYHEKSPSIFPVGFCASNNITLTPPNGYDVNTFNWETYLQETGSIAASHHLFLRLVPDHGFEVGMSLECADLMDPRLVCVATVARVVGRLLKIHFDGWTDEYDQWLDCESPDVYPVGWCVLVNHKLEGPPPPPQAQQTAKTTTKSKGQKKRKKKSNNNSATSKSAVDNTGGTVKPRTIALKTNPHLPKLSIKLELKPEHHNAAFYEENEEDDEVEYDEDSTTTTSHRSNQSTPLLPTTTTTITTTTTTTAPIAEVAATTAAVTGTRITQQVATPTPPLTTTTTTNQQPTTALTTNNTSSGNTGSNNAAKKPISPAPPTVGRKANSYIGNSSVSNSKYIPRLIDANDTTNNSSNIGGGGGADHQQTDLLPDTWNVYDVSQFLRVNDCTAHCDTFSRNKIDGKRLMQLSKDEIITLLGMKVGPALKIYDLIQQLKCKLNPSRSRLHKANKSFL